MKRDCIKPLAIQDVAIIDAFWAPKMKTYIEKSIPHSWQYVAGDLKATEAAATGERGEFNGTWGEANLYKLMETLAYALAIKPDPALSARMDELIALVGRAQQPDGFVHAYMTNRGIGSWVDEQNGPGHNGYVQGHLIEAAVELFQATGNTTFLDIARKVADCAWNRFLGPQGKPGFCGHSEMEMALVELYRVTGEQRYLDLGKAFLDWHGRGIMKFGHYTQDHLPVERQYSMEGHAVRAVFFATGVADVALETGDAAYRVAANRLWDSAVNRRMYITGSIGPRRESEAMGEDYELPMNGYNESCAACGLADFAQRMFILEGLSDSGDILERTLYNSILHGIAIDGCHSYYENPMSDRDHARDNNWTCCPPNLSRTLLQIGRYAYGQTERDLYVNLYVAGAATFALKKGKVTLTTTTRYPWEGEVGMVVSVSEPLTAAIHLRLPAWCHGVSLKVNGRTAAATPDPVSGFVVLDRRWKDGDRIDWCLEMPVHRVMAHPNVESCRGRVAIQRGPVVYGIEALDNGGRSEFSLGANPQFSTEWLPDLLGGIVRIRGLADDGTAFTAIPYFAMANREKTVQEVWLPQKGLADVRDGWFGRLYRAVNPAKDLAASAS